MVLLRTRSWAPRMSEVTLQPVGRHLPGDLSVMCADASAEGFRFLERLRADWNAGSLRFDKPGEALLIARRDGTLAGIGGMTADPHICTALRMRRFYVRPAFRRRGIAKALAKALIASAQKTGRPVTVNAGTATAPAFWESLGFLRVPNAGHTHVFPNAAAARA